MTSPGSNYGSIVCMAGNNVLANLLTLGIVATGLV